MKIFINQEIIKLLRDIAKNPIISQRELALRNGLSLGKVNYAIKSLISQGYLEIQNINGQNNKRKYRYVLTPTGMHEQSTRTPEFLRLKMEEYERLKRELTELEGDIIARLNQRIVRKISKPEGNVQSR